MTNPIVVNIKEFTSPQHVSRKVREAIDELCACGKDSDWGCHGVHDGEVYSEYYCKECYLKHKKDV
jgi:hypothetical protein